MNTKLSGVMTLLFVTAWTSPAFAGTSSSTMGTGVISMFDRVKDFLTGPIVISIASIMFILSLVGAYFSGGNDAAKKVLTIVAITAAIIAGPGIVLEVVNAAGATIAVV